MKGLWKQGGVAAVAAVACADIGRLSPLCAPGRARRAKLFLYGFALAFAVCTAYIAFSSSGGGGGGGSPPAGDWFGGVFASAAPYRSQISNFFSSMFPTNSSSPSPERRADGGGAARGGGSSSRGVAVKGGGEEGGGVGASRPVGSNNSSTIGSSKVSGSGGGAPSNNAGGGSGSPAGVKDEGGARSSSSASGNSTVPASSSAPAPPSDPLGDGAPMNNSAAGGGASKSGGGDPTGNSAGDGDVGKRGAKGGGVSINQAGSGSGAQSSGSAGNGSAEKADGSVGSGSVAKAEAKDVVVARGDAAKADVNTVVGSNNQSGSGVRNNGSANNGSASKAEAKDVFGARGNGNGSAGNGNAAKADLNNVVGSNNQSQSVTGAANAGLAKSNAKDGGIEPDKVGGSVAPKSNQTGSAGAPGKKDGGIQSKGTEASSKNQSVVVSPVVKDQNPTGSGVASSGSSGVVDKQKEATPCPQGSSGSLKDHSAQAVNSKAGNYSAVLVKGNGSPAKEDGNAGGEKNVDWIKEMAGCDIFHGKWVRDDSFPLYPEGSCPHIDEPFNCYLNGRPDRAYEKLRWQPDGCRIPRLNPTDMLERLRGKRLVFVGDSLNRNMWESLVCILWNFVKDKRKVFEASGRREFKTEGSYSFLFTDYNCSVEFFRSPFLVQEWEMPVSKGKKKETLRLDIIERSSPKYKDADFIIFNTGHWWTHEKTSLGKDYYQEGNHVYSELNVVDAFHKALNTWAKWIDANVNPKKTAVFFRGYSASHFSGGQWNSGGSCDKETEPITNENYLSSYPPKMSILEDVIHRMKTPVVYLNITRMTDYRKDAHPSVYRKQHMTEEERRSPERYQDCSHWCLPGVPDSWNELLYAQLLIKQHQMLRQ